MTGNLIVHARFVAMRCAGFDRVDLQACEAAGIAVARVPTYSPASVAEHAVAMLLCLNRRATNVYLLQPPMWVKNECFIPTIVLISFEVQCVHQQKSTYSYLN